MVPSMESVEGPSDEADAVHWLSARLAHLEDCGSAWSSNFKKSTAESKKECAPGCNGFLHSNAPAPDPTPGRMLDCVVVPRIIPFGQQGTYHNPSRPFCASSHSRGSHWSSTDDRPNSVVPSVILHLPAWRFRRRGVASWATPPPKSSL